MEYISIIIDVALLAIALVCIIEGITKGFLKSLLGIVGKVISLVVSVCLATPVAEFIYNNVLSGKLIDWVTKAFASPNQQEGLTKFLSNPLFENLASFGITIPSAEELLELGETGVANLFTTGAIGNFATEILRAIVFVVLMLIINAVLAFVIKQITKITRIPLIGAGDKLLGAVAGAVKGAIWIFIVSVLVYAISSINLISVLTPEVIQDTYILNFVINHNVIIKNIF